MDYLCIMLAGFSIGWIVRAISLQKKMEMLEWRIEMVEDMLEPCEEECEDCEQEESGDDPWEEENESYKNN